MNQNNSCPECLSILSENAKCCSCGWMLTVLPAEIIPDHRCQYVYQSRRCPAPGVVCKSVRGNSPWYCSDHGKTYDNPERAIAVLCDHLENWQTKNIVERGHEK